MEHTPVFITQEISVSEKTKSKTIDKFLTLENIIAEIKSATYQVTVELIRKSDKETRKEIKTNLLPVFYPCIHLPEYKALHSNKFFHTTGIIQFDVDNLTDNETINLNEKLIGIPELIYAFISPSGGIKFGIATDFQSKDTNTLKFEFKRAYALTKQYIKNQIDNIELDDSVAAVNQGCYFSYDPGAFLNNSPAILEVAEQAKVKWIEQETADNTKRINVNQDYGDIDKDEALKALQCIPADFKYEQRLPVNFAVISIFGNEAEDILLNHWQNDNPTKLQNDIRSQIKSYQSNGIGAGSLFHIAIKHGYTPRKHNEVSKLTEKQPTYNNPIYSLEQAQQKLENSITDFFDNGTNKLINFEAGGGKSKSVLNAIYEYKKKNNGKKIALFVATHEMAEQYQQDFQTLYESELVIEPNTSDFRKNSNKISSTFYREMQIQHIQGRHKLCNHPFKVMIEDTNNEIERKTLQKQFNQNASSFCKACNKRFSCEYINQFDSLSANIRIYTQQYLFNQRPLWDGGTYEEGVIEPKKNGFTPDFIIVDEDIVKLVLDNNLIETTSYNKAISVLQHIIHEMKQGISLEMVTKKYTDDIKQAEYEQDEALQNWQQSTSINFSADNQTIKQALENNQQPKVYGVLKELSEYADFIKHEQDETRNYAVYLNHKDELTYSSKNQIHPRFEEIPMILLDASADKAVVNAVFGENLNFESIRIKYQDNVKIHQCESNLFHRGYFQGDDAQENFDKVVEFIKSKSKGKRFGIISYQHIQGMPEFYNRLAEATNAEMTGYFGNIRGLNKFEELEQLYIIGRHGIGSGIEKYYRQLFGGIIKTDKDPNFERNTIVNAVYRVTSGKHKSIKQITYDDPNMQVLSNHFEKSETYQAAHRLRLIHSDKPKELFLLTNEVLDITIDELFRMEKKKHKSDERIQQIIQAIIDKGFVKNSPKDIAELAELTPKQISNMKAGLTDAIIGGNDNQIYLMEVTGTINGNTNTVNTFYIRKGYKVTKEEFGFDKITDIKNS